MPHVIGTRSIKPTPSRSGSSWPCNSDTIGFNVNNSLSTGFWRAQMTMTMSWNLTSLAMNFFRGMHPDDRPPTGYIPHRRIPPAAFHGPTPSGSVGTVVPSANVASSIASTGPVLGFMGFTSPAGFSTCNGLTLFEM
ncbi:unnamed protein product [Prunus armeniaca]